MVRIFSVWLRVVDLEGIAVASKCWRRAQWTVSLNALGETEVGFERGRGPTEGDRGRAMPSVFLVCWQATPASRPSLKALFALRLVVSVPIAAGTFASVSHDVVIPSMMS